MVGTRLQLQLYAYVLHGVLGFTASGRSNLVSFFIFQLAKRGLNVVLISRSLDKLKQTAAEIEQQHGRSTRVIRTDFTGGSEIYEPIRAALEGLEIGILVNNVGITGFHIGPFLSFPNLDKYTNDAVNCNMLSAVKMTQMLLPQMVAREKGIIINVASVAGRRPWPFNLLYGVTKTFVDFFSQGLDAEYGPKGIKVQEMYAGSWSKAEFLCQPLEPSGSSKQSLDHPTSHVPTFQRLSPAEQMFEKIMATQEATKDRLGKIEEELMAVKKLEEAFLQVRADLKDTKEQVEVVKDKCLTAGEAARRTRV
uniref:Uncharacterized protein n=1 Tax=Sphaerodactylus townsendi TaxID=933632 RepID=A0ACB8FSJ2_9SAUR